MSDSLKETMREDASAVREVGTSVQMLRAARTLLAEPNAPRTDSQMATSLADRLPEMRAEFDSWAAWQAFTRKVLRRGRLFVGNVEGGQGAPNFPDTSQGP